MLLLGLDFETTGLNTSKDNIIEVGAVLWDTCRAMPVQIYSDYIWHENIWNDTTSTKENIEKLTKISNDDIKNYGLPAKYVLEKVAALMTTPGLVAAVAHNGYDFDKPIFYANAKRWGVVLPEIPWIDTQYDVPYEMTIRKLPYLAAEHGFVNPFPHRAIFDVLTMMKILQHYDTEWVLKVSKIPRVMLIAETKAPGVDNGVSKNKAKALGFKFDGENKRWIKNVRENKVQAEIDAAKASNLDIRERIYL